MYRATRITATRFKKQQYKTFDSNELEFSEWRKAVLSRDSFRCTGINNLGKCCGATKTLQAHHVIPRSRGGRNTLSNGKTLCEICHQKMHKHLSNKNRY